GTESGTRLVLGIWSASPFGPIADAMIEDRRGHRTLLAPGPDAADFIAATYVFDEIRVEPLALRQTEGSVTVSSPSLRVEVRVGRRTGVGRLLMLVPDRLRRARWWCRAIGPVARTLRPGVRTVGTTGGGRREYYCAADEHLVESARASFDGIDLGELRPVLPSVRFGFASAPTTPSLVRVTTLIDIPE
ncbi:MAG TPA: hypothetical protein VHT50_10535, partial [Mycobacterium sp.]|nr:hypothetical protein [Mycobacterium sp.]